MARRVIPGIYRIKNKVNGKVYIGQSKNILKRLQYYYWSATTDHDYPDTIREITLEMRKFGVDNFDFDIIAQGPKYKNTQYRLQAEIKFIAMYHANDPRYGYNKSAGGEYSPGFSRQQSFTERLNRAKPTFLYNTENESVMLYMFGAKAIADDFGCDKAITSHALNRCDIFAEKYYIIPARYNERHKLYEKRMQIFNGIINKPGALDRIIKRTNNRKDRLTKAVKYIDTVAPEFGFTKD